MSLRESIEALVAAAPVDATVPVRWLGELLSIEHKEAPVTTVGAAAPRTDLTVGQVAARFGKGPSTVRDWLARGEFPSAYRLHGREWRIPLIAVEAMQRAQAERHRAKAPSTRSTERHANIGEWRKHLAKRRAS